MHLNIFFKVRQTKSKTFLYGVLYSGILHDMRSEFTDDVSEFTVGPTSMVILIHMTSDDATHSEFRNVFSKLASHIVRNPKNQKTVIISR